MMVDDGRCAVVAALMIREARRTVKHSSHMHVWWALAPVLTGMPGEKKLRKVRTNLCIEVAQHLPIQSLKLLLRLRGLSRFHLS